MMPDYPRIAIIGAGPAGLTLGRLLQIRNVPFTIYEADDSSETRTQGGTLDLHPASGQLALAQAGLLEKFKAIARFEAQELALCDKLGNVHLHFTPPNDFNNRPEIDRPMLRQILLDSILPENIFWGYRLETVAASENGSIRFLFQNGHEAEADVLIGADGVKSIVRQHLDFVEPDYTGITMVETRIPSVATTQPQIAKLVGRGSMYAFDKDGGLLAQRLGDGGVCVNVTLKVPYSWLRNSGIDFNKPSEARTDLLAYFDDWSEQLKDLIREGSGTIVPRQVYHLPLGQRWKAKKGLTLVGDAAHVMSPFAGEGVNLGMLDALDLANAIVEHGPNVEMCLKSYERDALFERSDAANQLARDSMCAAFDNNTPGGFADMLLEMHVGPCVAEKFADKEGKSIQVNAD